MSQGMIFDVKRFAIHDGDGIRTTLFFKGCPLSCVWCHNPEGISMKPEVAYYRHKCKCCGACAKACPEGAHSFTEGGHIFDRDKCLGRGECEAVCPNSAIKYYGRQVTADEILPELLSDRAFYENSGGGVTLSGGECLMQADFAAEILSRLKEEGIHTAVDTSGYVPREAFDKVLPYTDVFLYDVKAIDPAVHKRCTGRDNSLILNNLKYISSRGAAIEIRIPFVPGYNDSEITAIAEFLDTVGGITKIKVLPYHNLAASKYEALGMKNTLPERVPTDEELKSAISAIRSAAPLSHLR
ncbi:MAG: glycyl-radical enzyme activating protein [Clostridia bacterium]|nr:glycyl-radical enzyme activating protein [Clostridia bacterium]